MKIALFDPYTPKFTADMVDWWRNHGHEVKVDRYYDPELVDWADVVWFDTCDNNLKSATNPSEALIADWQKEGKTVPWALQEQDLTNKKIICRPIDIEVWQGHHAAVDWTPVNECVFVAEHIRDLMMNDSRPQASNMNIHTIPCGVNLDRYEFKQREHGYNIGIVSEVWESKGVDYVLQIALKLKTLDPRYKIQWVGKFQDYHWDQAYTHDFVKRNDLPLEFVDWVESIDTFLDDKNYLLHASKKEAFSYATAEAMAKGIKPVLHHFYGAEKLWGGMTWNSLDEALDMFSPSSPYDSDSYRQYLIDHRYTTPLQMESIMKVING